MPWFWPALISIGHWLKEPYIYWHPESWYADYQWISNALSEVFGIEKLLEWNFGRSCIRTFKSLLGVISKRGDFPFLSKGARAKVVKRAEKKLKGSKGGQIQGNMEQRAKTWREKGVRTPLTEPHLLLHGQLSGGKTWKRSYFISCASVLSVSSYLLKFPTPWQ